MLAFVGIVAEELCTPDEDIHDKSREQKEPGVFSSVNWRERELWFGSSGFILGGIDSIELNGGVVNGGWARGRRLRCIRQLNTC